MLFDHFRVKDIELVLKIFQPEGKVLPFDNRKNYGLLFVEHGKLNYIQDHVAHLSDNSHILFIPKGISYTLNGIVDSETYVVNFDLYEPETYTEIISLNAAASPSILRTLKDMERLWSFHGQYYDVKVMGLFYEILGMVGDGLVSEYIPRSKRLRIAPSIAYIENHLNDPNINNDLLARESGVSTVYFRKLFQELYKTSPMKYVQNLRIEKAKALLSSGYSSVTETAFAMGFNNIYHFSRMFKKSTGLSPTQFMEQRNKSSQDRPGNGKS